MSKWVKISYTCMTKVSTSHSLKTIKTDSVIPADVYKLVKKWAKSFSGKGVFRLNSIQVGPNKEDDLSEMDKSNFIGKYYNFNN